MISIRGIKMYTKSLVSLLVGSSLLLGACAKKDDNAPATSSSSVPEVLVFMKPVVGSELTSAQYAQIKNAFVVKSSMMLPPGELLFPSKKMTPEEIKTAEDLVNAAIKRDYPVSWQEMSFEEAKAKGAIGLFEDRYQPIVKVYTIGDVNEKMVADPTSPTYSQEVCGGPHVEHTGVLGHFKIVKEEAVSAGMRRIKAILE